MSALTDIAITLATEAAKAIIKAKLAPKDHPAAFDAVAERLRFDAEGDRKLAARKAKKR